MLNWREGKHASIGADECIGRDVFILRKFPNIGPLCKMPEHMRIKARCRFLVFGIQRVYVGLGDESLLKSHERL